MSVASLYQLSAKSYATAGKVAPHRPVHGPRINTCTQCGHVIGWVTNPDADPVHNVPGECRCGAYLPPFVYTCANCKAEQAEAAEAARQQRLRGMTWDAPVEEEDTDDAVEPDRTPRSGGNPLYQEARIYAAQYTGTFPFMLDMKLRVTGPKGERFPLSARQVEAILKCKKADEERAARLAKAAKERVQTGRDLTVLPIGRTYAAVDNDSGGVTFLIIDRPADTSKWAGWVFVKQQVSDEEHKLGSQRPGESYVGQWANLIDKVLADPVAAVARYGLELGVCGICNRTLTNDESRERGIGPVCLAKLESGL